MRADDPPPARGRPYAPVAILIQELPGRETQVANTVASATVPNGDAAASQIARRLDIEVLGLLHHEAGRAPNCGTSVPENALAQPAGGLECAGPESRRPRTLLGAPGQIAAEVRFGALTGGALEVGQIGSHCQTQLVSERRQRIRRH
jgi:hypothetical protein